MKISKYSIISFAIVYIILGYTLFPIKYTSLVGTPAQQTFIDKFINSITHMLTLKIVIASFVAVLINLILNRKIKSN